MDLAKYDKFVNSSTILSKDVILNEFYGNVVNNYYTNKINIMNNNFASYWCGLDMSNKAKWLKLLNLNITDYNYFNNIVLISFNVSYDTIINEIFINCSDEYCNNKIKYCNNNFPKFWNDLTNNEKNKYVQFANTQYPPQNNFL